MKMIADINGIETGLFGGDCIIQEFARRILFCSGFPT
jgi:hypothetical protein